MTRARRWNALLPSMLCALLAACASTRSLEESPRVSIVALRPISIGLLEQRYTVQLRVQNPNRVDLAIQGLDYTIEVNERSFASGVNASDVLIPAFGEELVEVIVSSNLTSLMRQIQLLAERKEPLRYRITGRIAIAGIPGTVPYSHDGELTLGALKHAARPA
jgi:LEA14-like dessication related protein